MTLLIFQCIYLTKLAKNMSWFYFMSNIIFSPSCHCPNLGFEKFRVNNIYVCVRVCVCVCVCVCVSFLCF